MPQQLSQIVIHKRQELERIRYAKDAALSCGLWQQCQVLNPIYDAIPLSETRPASVDTVNLDEGVAQEILTIRSLAHELNRKELHVAASVTARWEQRNQLSGHQAQNAALEVIRRAGLNVDVWRRGVLGQRRDPCERDTDEVPDVEKASSRAGVGIF